MGIECVGVGHELSEAALTTIEWTDETWNPTRGCSRVDDDGCKNCYAMRFAHRFSAPGQRYEGLTRIGKRGVDWAGRAKLIPEQLAKPLNWRKPRRIFVDSMSDLFHESLPFEHIAAVFGVMAACPQHTFQVLTKRPKRAAEFFGWLGSEAGLEGGTEPPNYLKLGAAEVAKTLGRSRVSVMKKARLVGVQSHRRWTADDDQHLASLWGTMSIGHIARALGRTVATTYWRARKLGLPCGAPQGLEYITAAATRTGFETTQLWRILRWARVRAVRSMSRPTPGARYHFHVVDPLDVDDAVERWLATESVEAAARARGLVGDTLRKWIRAAGVPKPPRLKARKHWRIESTVIDRVIAERMAKRSVRSQAQRVGVRPGTLRAWLIKGGVERPPGKLWLVAPAEVDRVVASMRRRGK